MSAQDWEKNWWGTCQNTYGEEEKQLLYANRMGLQFHHNKKSPYNIDLKGISVLDIGGGPCSLLLKCTNVGSLAVIDPCDYPMWVGVRYDLAGIYLDKIRGEDIGGGLKYDECWIYNCLQHTDDPEKIIQNAKKSSKAIRIFEWIDTVKNEGHPHVLTEAGLNKWLGGTGKVEHLKGQAHCFGRCYYGIFTTEGGAV